MSRLTLTLIPLISCAGLKKSETVKALKEASKELPELVKETKEVAVSLQPVGPAVEKALDWITLGIPILGLAILVLIFIMIYHKLTSKKRHEKYSSAKKGWYTRKGL